MRGRPGVQAELLLSLALIMFTATALLLVFFLELYRFQTEKLHDLLARGFTSGIQKEGFFDHGFREGVWWRLDEQGEVVMSSEALPLDEETLALARVALERGRAHVQSGPPWVPIRFASPVLEGEEVVAGKVDAPLSGFALAGLILVDLSVFGYFGFTLLRRRVVGPLAELAQAVREVGEGGLSNSVRVEGTGEVAELASAFNEMQTALSMRTGSLEKAVEELRNVNQRLVHAREGLDRAERLAMVGSMAAGVAHEVGNPMGAMLSFLDVAAQDKGMGDQAQHCLGRASEQGERVRVILRQLLDFSRAPQIEHSAFSMKEVADQVVELITAQHEYGKVELEVVTPGAESELQCWGDRGHASQILLNLILNAVSALREVPETRIRIRLETGYGQERTRGGESRGIESRFPDRIHCFVEDSGTGVTLENAERIFDPFFTTKGPGEGTGLGLANARKLAEEMNGEVSLEQAQSDLGGALFRFSLPRSGSEVRSESSPE